MTLQSPTQPSTCVFRVPMLSKISQLCTAAWHLQLFRQRTTMEYLQGKPWGEPEVLEGASMHLNKISTSRIMFLEACQCIESLLHLGFFFRFWHDIGGELKLSTSQKFDDAVYEIERQISKGYRDPDNPQYIDCISELTIVNKNLWVSLSTILLL